MILIVDAYNVLHTTGVLPPDLAGATVDGLRDLVRVSRYRRRHTVLVCDGAAPVDESGAEAPAASTDNVEIQYAGRGQDADSLIEKMIARSDAPRRLLVVSSDRRIINAAKQRRCRVLASDVFLSRLARDWRQRANRRGRPAQAYDLPLDASSLRWWIQFFGYDPDHPEVGTVELPPMPNVTPAPQVNEHEEIRVDGDGHIRGDAGDADSGIHEADPTRWWIRYFGMDPDQLPAEVREAASASDEGVAPDLVNDVPTASDAPEVSGEVDSDVPIEGDRSAGRDQRIDVDSIDMEDYL